MFYVRRPEGDGLCPGGDAGSGLEAGRPEYGILHPTGVAERHGLAAVRRPPLVTLHAVSSPSLVMSFKRCVGVCLRHLSAVVRCDSTERLRNSLDYLRSVLNDSTSFKLIYRYAFDFARVSQAKCH